MILLTGATGFIGTHLLSGLAGRDKIRCLVRPCSKRKIPHQSSIQIVERDLLNKASLAEDLEGVDTVIHLAALLRGRDPRLIWQVNVEGTSRLLDAARAKGVKKIIFLSTENVLCDELHDAYTNSKREAENMVRAFTGHVLLRVDNVYGPGDVNGLGKVMAFLKRMPLFPLIGNGQAKRQPIYVEDVVAYILAALDRNVHGTFFLGCQNAVQFCDILTGMMQKLCLYRMLIPIPRWVWSIGAKVIEKIRPESGWGRARLLSLGVSRYHDMKPTIDALGHIPLEWEEGLRQWMAICNR